MAWPTSLIFAGGGGGASKVVRTLHMRLLIPKHRPGDDADHLTRQGFVRILSSQEATERNHHS
jgi:hypothetical protein